MENYNYFEKIVIQTTSAMLSDATNLFVPIGLEILSNNIQLKDNQYFKSVFGDDDGPCGFMNPITKTIYINIEHQFFSERSILMDDSKLIARLMFILFHENNHNLLSHEIRRQERDQQLWNICADYEIHNMLYIYYRVFNGTEIIKQYLNIISHFLFSNNPMFLFEQDYLELSAEEIYDLLVNTKTISEQIDMYYDPSTDSFSDQQQNVSDIKCTVKTVTYNLPKNKKYKQTTITFDENNIPNQYKQTNQQKQKQQEDVNLRKVLMENTLRQVVQDRGFQSNECMILLGKLFNIKVDWNTIFKNSLHTVLEKTDMFSWKEIRLTSLTLPIGYLPGLDDSESKPGTVIISRDESGSMSNEQLEKAASIINDSKQYFDKIIVIKHDVEISSVKEFEHLDKDVIQHILTRESSGGTSHKHVFEYIKEYIKYNQISCYIGITDMESDIENNQNIIPTNIPVFWLCPTKYYKIYKNNNTIRGQLIPLEL